MSSVPTGTFAENDMHEKGEKLLCNDEETSL